MKTKTVFLLFLLFFTCYTQAQSINSIEPISQTIQRHSLLNKMIALTFNYKKPMHVKGIAKLSEIYTTEYKESSDPLIKSTVTLLNNNSDKLARYFNSISSFGESEPYIYFDTPKEGEILQLPFGFSSQNNGIVFYHAGIFYDKALNTLVANANERAKSVIKNVVLPSLFNLEELMSSESIKSYCIIVGYVAKDFSKESDMGDGETVAIIVTKPVLKKYIEAVITDEQLISQSVFYNSNKAIGGNIKKITIN